MASSQGVGEDGNKTTSSFSWILQLQAYMREQTPLASASGATSQQAGHRKVLCDVVLDNPNSAEAWYNFLENEECSRQGGNLAEAIDHHRDMDAATSSGGKAPTVGLYHLYHKATELVQRSKGRPLDAYVKIWVGYARHQWQHNEDEARDTFKTLKNQHIADSNAFLFHAWAFLEASSGNTSKALSILGKALKENAQPASILHGLLTELQDGPQPHAHHQEHLLPPSSASTQYPKTPHSHAAPPTVGRTSATATTPGPSPQHQHQQSQPQQHTCGGQGGQLQFKTPVAMPQHHPYATSNGHHTHTSHSTSSYSSGGSLHGGSASTGLRFASSFTGAASGTRTQATALHVSGTSTPYPALHPLQLPSSGPPPEQQQQHQQQVAEAATRPVPPSSLHPAHTAPPPHASTSYRTLHSLSSSEDDPSFQKGSDNTATMTSATAALASDVSMRTVQYEGDCIPASSAHPQSINTQGAGGSLTARGGNSDGNQTGGANLTGGLSGNHTAQMGIKRFGFKSKALRVTHASEHGLAAVAAALGEKGQLAGYPSSSGTAVGYMAADGAANDDKAMTPTALATAASAGEGSRCSIGSQEGGEGSASRKRRAASGHYSPRTCSAVVEDGAKRRTSPPSLHITSAALEQQPQQPSTVSPTAGAAFAFPQLPTPIANSSPHAVAAAPPPLAATAATQDPSSKPHHHAVPVVAAGLEPPVQPQQAPSQQQPAPAAAPTTAQVSVYRSKLKQQGVQMPSSENEAPFVPLHQAQGVAGVEKVQEQQAKDQFLKQTGLKGGQVPSAADAKPIQQQQQHREPLRVVQAPAQRAGSNLQASSAAAVRPEQQQQQQQVQGDGQAQQAQQQQVQQQHMQQQQAVTAGAAASNSTPDLRAAPPERLPEPQRRALEDANWVYVNGLRYQKLDCVGRGGSSKVFKVLGCNRQIYALKRVRLANKDPEAIRGFIDEITLLKQLRNTPNIIQLISAQVFREECLIYMVLEYGDIDLARLLQNHEEARRRQLVNGGGGAVAAGGGSSVPSAVAGGSGEIDENFIRLYWQQMLQAVGGIHDLRIVHSDLKPANFLLVQGQLKLIDFGIAKSIQGDTTSINRESQVGTLNYMSPEAIQGGSSNPLGGPPLKVGRPSDVWSLGCILYQMVYGQTPFADIPFIPKMNAICNPNHSIRFATCANPAAADAMARCLDRNTRTRISIPELLDHAFLHPERVMTAAPSGGVSEEQLKNIVSQIALAGASGTADIDTLTRQVLAQLKSQQSVPEPPAHGKAMPGAAPAPQQQHPQRHRPIRPPTPARSVAAVPLSPCDQSSSPASPMDADTPSPHCRQRARQQHAKEAGVQQGGEGQRELTPQGSGASAAAAGLERLHFEDEACSS